MKKFTEKVNEAYQMDLDRGDIADEHAKEIISHFIENELDGADLQDSFDKVYEENMKGMGGPGSDDQQGTVIQALIDYVENLRSEINNLEINK